MRKREGLLRRGLVGGPYRGMGRGVRDFFKSRRVEVDGTRPDGTEGGCARYFLNLYFPQHPRACGFGWRCASWRDVDGAG